MRALLHEPLRYHPNVVRLLDMVWGASSETGSALPSIVLEYAEFGNLLQLQKSQTTPLPFRIKQKLFYDVGRGLSILHACGIVHGDLKHENVLVFRNPYEYPPNQPYTAKLTDFGGAVIENSASASFLLPMGTIPFTAPELKLPLTSEGVKRTDVYSFGMLIWRGFTDCIDILRSLGINLENGRTTLTTEEQERLDKLKSSPQDDVFMKAIESTYHYMQSKSMSQEVLKLVVSAMSFTLRVDPDRRALDQTQALLRGMSLDEMKRYIAVKNQANEWRAENERRRTPGSHGLDVDSVGYGLGRIGDDYDAQNNLPGYRPDLARPDPSNFMFDPWKLRSILTWEQQVELVKEFEVIATSPYNEASTNLQPWIASYYLFQSYLSSFGTSFDAEKACYWLYKTSLKEDHATTTDYLAKAWLVRVCEALNVPIQKASMTK